MARPPFFGANLRLARQAAGLKQADVAELVTTSASYISELERDLRRPNEILLQALGEVLGVQAEFFAQAPSDLLDLAEVNFRHRSSTPKWLKAKVAGKATLFGRVARYLDTSLGFPDFDVPQAAASSQTEVEAAALLCRKHWSLGLEAPISNMVRVAENAGVVVTEFHEAEKVDAFSVSLSDIGVIVLNTARESTSRARWNIAHEIGHLVLHRGRETGDRETEAQANWFAASFLLPARAFSTEFGRLEGLGWPHLLELKRRWKVALAAIIKRAFDLHLLSAVGYRRLYKSLSAKGWRKGEPQEPPAEPPELMSMAIKVLDTEFGLSPRDVAKELFLDREKMAEVTGFEVPLELPENVTPIGRFKARRKTG